MKFIFTLLLGIGLTFPLLAGEKTLLSGDIDHGGYGGPVVKFTQIGPNSDFGYLVGGQGGWIINHTFVIGGGGYGVSNQIQADWLASDIVFPSYPLLLNFGYGGLFLAYIHNSDDLIHYEVNAIVGGGNVGYRYDNDVDYDYNNDNFFDDQFFVFEPGVNLEFNVTSFFRISAGASYRVIQGANTQGITSNDLSGISGQIFLKFGSF